MREDQVDAARMNVERLHAAALGDFRQRHRRALEMPAGTPAPERRVPRRAHGLILGIRFLPEGEIARVAFGVLVARHPRADFDLAPVELRQPAVGRKLRDREVDGAILSFICDAALEQLRDEGDHLRHVLGCRCVYVRRLDAQVIAVFEEGFRERRSVRGQLLPGLARGLDGAVVHVGEIHDVEDIVARTLQPAAQQILEQEGAEVADVRVVPDGGAAGIQRHAWRRERLERLDPAGQRVEQRWRCVGHGRKNLAPRRNAQ